MALNSVRHSLLCNNFDFFKSLLKMVIIVLYAKIDNSIGTYRPCSFKGVFVYIAEYVSLWVRKDLKGNRTVVIF